MEDNIPFIYPFSDFMLNIVGLALFLLDLALDIWAVVNFYQEKAYAAMGVLIFLLLGSSVLIHAFSWLWYNYESEEERKDLDKHVYLEKYFTNRRLLGLLHVFQVGIFFRFASMMEISLRSLSNTSRQKKKEGIAVFLTHDLSFLRFIETFAESAPQLTLMIAFIERREELELVTVLKTLGSIAAISFSVVSYHRSMRAFIEDKANMTWFSSLVFFLWNFLLIVPRVAAIALCASSLPAWVTAAHFILLWSSLFYWASRQQTDFMDSSHGERLFRATVGLIWYFSWFNVSKGRSKGRSIIYHLFIAVDIMLLLVAWWCWWGWGSDQDTFIFGLSAMWVLILAGSSYVIGIIIKIIYYKLCHPKSSANKESEDDVKPAAACMVLDVVDFPQKALGMAVAEFSQEEYGMDVPDSALFKAQPKKPITGAKKRMQRLADNF